MPKITDANYHLPEVIPLQWVRTLSSGANKPVVIRGIDGAAHESGEYVLKYRGAERMDEAACRRELLAAWIAAEMDIAVPEPVIIQVDAGFASCLPDNIQAIVATRALGPNFGNRFIEGKTIFQPGAMLTPELRQSAARVFAFDLLTQNADRRHEKPNAFLANGAIYAIDHELAFGFLSMLPMFANPNPWILNQTDVLAARQHLFYPALRSYSDVDWGAALGAIHKLTPLFWQRVSELIPENWKDDGEISRIQNHFDSIQQHTSTLQSEIWNKIFG
jgi:hypothetical protein